MPFPHKLDQRVIDLLGVRGTQEVLAVLDSQEIRGWRIDEELDLLLRVGDGIDCVIGSLDEKYELAFGVV